MDDRLIAAYSSVINDLQHAPEGWEKDSLRVALSVLVTRRMELENWDTFTPVVSE
jgi:hypothetical protein